MRGAIVGAGPAGLYLALLLKRQHHVSRSSARATRRSRGIPVPASQRPAARRMRPAGPPVLMVEFVQHVHDPADGTTYVARVYGRPRVNGTWEGWLEFVAVGAAVVLRTEQETTQSSREGVAYWASGLEPSYVEGAFARARRESVAAVSV